MNNKECHVCKNHLYVSKWFKFLGTVLTYQCKKCKKSTHHHCVSTIAFNRFCNQCAPKIQREIDSIKFIPIDEVKILMKAKKHHIDEKKFNRIKSQEWVQRRNKDTAMENLKYQALQLGANAIIKYRGGKEKKITEYNGYIHHDVAPSVQPVWIEKVKSKKKSIRIAIKKKASGDQLSFPETLPEIKNVI